MKYTEHCFPVFVFYKVFDILNELLQFEHAQKLMWVVFVIPEYQNINVTTHWSTT